MRRCIVVVSVAVMLTVLGALVALSQFNLSAIPEPGRLETFLATKARHLLVRKSSGQGIPRAPIDLQASIKEGDMLYGVECAACHGLNGHKPTDAGRWMYPRAADLTSAEVQQYSDGELFWIVKNGIRLSGMPAFGEVEPDEHIWNLVQYVRTLRDAVRPTGRK